MHAFRLIIGCSTCVLMPLVLVLACTSFRASDAPTLDGGDEPGTSALDGAARDATATLCRPDAPFAPPTPVRGVNTPDREDGIWFFPDVLYAYITTRNDLITIELHT